MEISNNMSLNSISTRISLSDGNTMPIFGLGCWNMKEDAVYNAVRAAVNDGYRLFDTARYYNNEHTVGKALIDSGLPRDEYFVVTKLFPHNHGYEETKLNLKQSLEYFCLDYVDLFLIHSPRNGKNVDTWKAFVELKQEGLTKSIGVSNYNIQHLEALIATGMEAPSVNQFELHPWNQHKPTVKYCREKNIAVMGYCPLARGQLFGDGKYPVIDKLSKTYKQTKAQIILRWAVQSGFITIPKSENKERIKENGGLFGWTLSKDDMNLIDNLDEQLSISSVDGIMVTEWQG